MGVFLDAQLEIGSHVVDEATNKGGRSNRLATIIGVVDPEEMTFQLAKGTEFRGAPGRLVVAAWTLATGPTRLAGWFRSIMCDLGSEIR